MPSPLLDHDHAEPSFFRPENLLEGARRQKGLPRSPVPAGCLLDIDGAHVTNAMATRPGDFEKGGRDGQDEALEVCSRALAAALAHGRAEPAARGGQVP
jgi:hypothetical protein